VILKKTFCDPLLQNVFQMNIYSIKSWIKFWIGRRIII
jgi:hypothetical protein